MASPEPAQDVNERLSAALKAIQQRLNRPEFGATTLRAQIMSNAYAFVHMNLVLDNDDLPYKQEPPMTIITTNENGKTRASVVLYHTDDDHKVVTAHLQGSLAGSDSEALLSLYEASKNWTASVKAELVKKGWWRDGPYIQVALKRLGGN